VIQGAIKEIFFKNYIRNENNTMVYISVGHTVWKQKREKEQY
jgi:hypothetical protein